MRQGPSYAPFLEPKLQVSMLKYWKQLEFSFIPEIRSLWNFLHPIRNQLFSFSLLWYAHFLESAFQQVSLLAQNSRDCFCDFHPKHPSHHISHWAICINHFYKTQESSTQHFRYSNICFIKKKFLYNILMCQTKLNPKHFMSIMGWISPVWEELTALWSCSVTVRWQLILLKDHFLYLAKMCFFVFLSSWPCSAIHHTE